MQRLKVLWSLSLVMTIAIASLDTPPVYAAEADDHTIEMADGKLVLMAPKSWERKQPATRIVEHEFAIPPAGDDKVPARLTVMPSGGSIEANIDRWRSQFSKLADDGAKDESDVKEIQVQGMDVHLVDLSGTFKDQRGPFAPAVTRENYRMLGAIIVTKDLGNHFVKLVGPASTVEENKKAFVTMIEELKKK